MGLGKSKVVRVWRNNGGWANLYIDFENNLRLVVRLFNEWSQDIQLEEIVSSQEQMIVINDTSENIVKNNLIGKEYNLSLLVECHNKSMVKNIHNIVEECWINEEYMYPQGWGDGKITAQDTGDKEIDAMVQDFFDVAYAETIKMINGEE